VGFIKWPQIYSAEAEKLKGGIFNDRKCINNFLFFIGGEKPEIGIRLLLVKENNSNAVHLVHHYSKPDPKPISDITYHQKTTPYKT
jgi:hypothetical protein